MTCDEVTARALARLPTWAAVAQSALDGGLVILQKTSGAPFLFSWRSLEVEPFMKFLNVPYVHVAPWCFSRVFHMCSYEPTSGTAAVVPSRTTHLRSSRSM